MTKKNLLTLFKIILLFAIYSWNLQSFADPFTDYFMERNRVKNLSDSEYNDLIRSYFEKHFLTERGGLPLVGSRFGKFNIRGGGFTVKLPDGKMLVVTNSHLIQGESPFVEFNTVDNDRLVEKHQGRIAPEDVFSCADSDVSVFQIEAVNGLKQSPAIFAEVSVNRDKIFSYGMNNSPVSYLKSSYYEFPSGDQYRNLNKRPLFENTHSGETYEFVQAGNMQDLSCNTYPSSPEPYAGNGIFVPISQRVKSFVKEPNAFSQSVFNQINSYEFYLEMYANNQCSVNTNIELKDNLKEAQSAWTGDLMLPVGVVPGMSGLPLLTNSDLRQSKYEVSGMVTRFDRRTKLSYFVSGPNILKCIKKFLKNPKGNGSETRFNYSGQYNTLFRQNEHFSEIPVSKYGKGFGESAARKDVGRVKDLPAGDFDSGSSGDGSIAEAGDFDTGSSGDGSIAEAGDFDSGSSGDGSIAEAGDVDSSSSGDGSIAEAGDIESGTSGDGSIAEGGDIDVGTSGDGSIAEGGSGAKAQSTKPTEQVLPPLGMRYKDQHIVAFSCRLSSSGKPSYVYANWDGVDLFSDASNQCTPIVFDDRLNLAQILRDRFGRKNSFKGVSAKSSSNQSLEVKVRLTLVGEQELKLETEGSIKLPTGKTLDLKSEMIFPLVPSKFNPIVEVPLLNSEGGNKLIIDIRDLFFTNLQRLPKGRFSQGNPKFKVIRSRPKVFVSLLRQGAPAGSTPVVIQW